jgi:hypothetical protein
VKELVIRIGKEPRISGSFCCVFLWCSSIWSHVLIVFMALDSSVDIASVCFADAGESDEIMNSLYSLFPVDALRFLCREVVGSSPLYTAEKGRGQSESFNALARPLIRIPGISGLVARLLNTQELTEDHFEKMVMEISGTLVHWWVTVIKRSFRRKALECLGSTANILDVDSKYVADLDLVLNSSVVQLGGVRQQVWDIFAAFDLVIEDSCETTGESLVLSRGFGIVKEGDEYFVRKV